MPRKRTVPPARTTTDGSTRVTPKIDGISVYPRGKKWAYLVTGDPDPLTQKRPRLYKGDFEDETSAFNAALLVKADLEKASVGRRKSSKATVKDVVEEFLTSVEGVVKPSTFGNWRVNADSYVYPLIGHHPFVRVETATLNAFYKRLQSDGRCKPDNNIVMYRFWKKNQHLRDGKGPTSAEVARACGVTIHAAKAAVTRYRRGRVAKPQPAGLAQKSIRNVHGLLQLVWVEAIGWRYTTENPTAFAKIPREPGGRKATMRQEPWTLEELARWLVVALQDRFSGMWVVAATTGMRRSELAGAEAAYLDREKRQLKVFDTRVVVNGQPVDSDGKSEAGWRTVSLDDFAFTELSAHIGMLHRERKEFGCSYPAHGKLMVWENGKRLHPDTITRRFNKLVDLAGVPQIDLHDIRHVYITLARDHGVNRKTLADRVGHANETVTDTIYTHRTTGMDRDLAHTMGVVIRDAVDRAKQSAHQ